MARTYVPTLVDIVHKLCVYIARHSVAIRAALPPDAQAEFTALELACSAFNALSGVIDEVQP